MYKKPLIYLVIGYNKYSRLIEAFNDTLDIKFAIILTKSTHNQFYIVGIRMSLERFAKAQATTYADALAEVKNGKKRTHWMWFIFPQIQGLGNSEFARHYAIKDINEAEAYLNHPVLGKRLIEISGALLKLNSNDAYAIFGSPDDMKLHSSMTLFSLTQSTHPVFKQVLQEFYNGVQDPKTLQIIAK